MGMQERERAEENANGGIVERHGDIVVMGNGALWQLNGAAWARNEADALQVSRQVADRMIEAMRR